MGTATVPAAASGVPPDAFFPFSALTLDEAQQAPKELSTVEPAEHYYLASGRRSVYRKPCHHRLDQAAKNGCEPIVDNDAPNPTEPAAQAGDSELEFLRWDDGRMRTGIESIDEQHKELIRTLNELHRACLSGARLEDIEKALQYLGRYAEKHFRHEERLMDERKCPIRFENRIAHARFLNHYRELASKYRECDPDQIATEIKNMAARWLSAHICRLDIALRDCPPSEQSNLA